jgi:uncharacterized protein (TIGR02300 family)
MSNKADIKALRGTKRTCQNEECGSRFYDLNRDPITCPTCNTVYVIDLLPAPQEVVRAAPKPVRKPAFVPGDTKPDAAPEVEGEELVAIEGEEEVDIEDETVLEPEEDASDVSGIIDAPIEDTDEKN